MIRKIIYYILILFAFLILTILIPFLAIKEYISILRVNKIKSKWLAKELLNYYSDLKDIIGMFILQ